MKTIQKQDLGYEEYESIHTAKITKEKGVKKTGMIE